MQIQFLDADVARKFCDIVANEDTTFFTFFGRITGGKKKLLWVCGVFKIFCYNESGGAETKK